MASPPLIASRSGAHDRDTHDKRASSPGTLVARFISFPARDKSDSTKPRCRMADTLFRPAAQRIQGWQYALAPSSKLPWLPPDGSPFALNGVTMMHPDRTVA
jgi:hypothetical protein